MLLVPSLCCAWGHFEDSNGDAQGLADGRGTAALSVLLYWTRWNSSVSTNQRDGTCGWVDVEAKIHVQPMEGPTLAQMSLMEGKPGQATDGVGSWQRAMKMWKKETMLEQVCWQDL